jgi:hypothetical protein
MALKILQGKNNDLFLSNFYPLPDRAKRAQQNHMGLYSLMGGKKRAIATL